LAITTAQRNRVKDFDRMQWMELGFGKAESDDHKDFEQIFSRHLQDKKVLRGFEPHFEELITKGPDLAHIWEIEKIVQCNMERKRIFWMADGSIGLGPINVQPNDIVCVLGCSYFPVVLRKIGTRHIFVGCCFVYGLMDGEVGGMMDLNGMEAVRYHIQ
jgi:hypothetical protein